MNWKKIVANEIDSTDHGAHHTKHFSDGVALDTELLKHIPLDMTLGFGEPRGYSTIRHTDKAHPHIFKNLKNAIERNVKNDDYTGLMSTLSVAAYLHHKEHLEGSDLDHNHNDAAAADDVKRRKQENDEHMRDIRTAIETEKTNEAQ